VPVYCPVCGRYSDKFPTPKRRDDHVLEIHPGSAEAVEITERRYKGYAQDLVGKTTKES